MSLGVNGDGLVAVMRAIEADNGPAQTSGAERQRRYRERQKQDSDVTRDVTSDVTGPLTPALSPPDPPIPTPDPPHGDTPRARKAEPFICPDGVEAQHWRDFLANRRRKSLTNTETAYAGQLRLIAQFADDEWPPGKLVQLAAEKGWGTIVNPRESEHRNGNGRLAQRTTESTGIGRTEAVAIDIKARIRSAKQSASGGPGGLD